MWLRIKQGKVNEIFPGKHSYESFFVQISDICLWRTTSYSLRSTFISDALQVTQLRLSSFHRKQDFGFSFILFEGRYCGEKKKNERHFVIVPKPTLLGIQVAIATKSPVESSFRLNPWKLVGAD